MAVALGVNGGILGPANTPSLSSASGLWTWAEQYRAQRGGTWPPFVTPDPYFDYVTLMLHGNGTNGAQNNTFLDSSTNNFTITRNGNTTQGTFTPYGSNWGNYFDGSGDYLTAADNAAFQLGAGAFTIEAFFYSTSSGDQVIISKWGSPDSNAAWEIIYYAGTLYCQVASGSTVTTLTTTTFPLNQWNHVVMVRSGNTLSAYLNGTRFATNGAYSSTVNAGTNGISIGTRAGGSSFPMVGYISNARVVKGTAVYDPTQTTLTVPTAPLTAITNTSLLTCQSNRFIDNSSNNFTITRNGDVSVQRFSPFNPTTPYAAGAIGGSGYFDGSGDSLTTSSSAVSYAGDFCIECWFYTSTTTVYASLYSDETGSSGGTILLNNASANGQITVYCGGINNFASTSTGLNNSAWHHVAFTRSGSTVRLFIDGKLENTTTASGTITSPGTVRVGSSYYASRDFSGYIAGFRIVSGSAVYTSAFTPPTAPPTAITNTSFLLNFTNGGIIDNAMMNDLETVGNAQISTSVSKFGGGSMSIPGGGANLYIPPSPNFDMGTGDFTIECWVNSTSIAANYPSFISSSTGWSAGSSGHRFNNLGAANKFTFHLNGAGDPFLTSTNTYSFGVWYHYALTRSGNTWRMFIDGVQQASGTFTGSFNAALGGFRLGYAQWDGTNGYYNGYIDDLRITKGYARYTANFTPPTAPFPDQ